jgi:uncharacterized lipoprotein YajG
MKNIILLACFLLFAGCAKQPVIANLNLRIGEQPGGLYPATLSAAISGRDSRKSQDVVVYASDEPPTGLANIRTPQELLEEKLAEGLRSQGLRLDPASPVHLMFDIKELLVRVSRPKMLYLAEGKTFITLTVENRGTVFTKTYKREATKESARRPDLPKLEEMLNSHLADIVQQMLQDREVRNLIGRG